MHRIPEWKKNTVKELVDYCRRYPVVAIMGIEGITAEQMQKMRRSLKDLGVLRITRNTLIRLALDGANDGFKKLKDYVAGQTAIFFTDENPFRIFKKMEESKTEAPLKANMISPVDIVVEKGPTSFRPGPVVSELQSAGIPAAIEKGKVVIKETRVVLKQGERVDPKLAEALAKLEIKPLKVGFDIRAIYEDGIIYLPETLRLDVDEYFNLIVTAAQNAMNLSINAVYPTVHNISQLLIKAHTEARNLAINAGIFEKDVIGDIIASVSSKAMALVSILPEEALDEDLKTVITSAKPAVEVKKEEKKEEEDEKEEEEEEKSEEEAIEGLGALFG